MTDNTESIDEVVEEMVDRGALPSEYVDLIAKEVAKALEDVYAEQKIWMHEHTELKLGYATYMLTIVKDRATKEEDK